MRRKVYTIKGLLMTRNKDNDKYDKATMIQCHVATRFKFLAKRRGRKILESKFKEEIEKGSIIIINKPPIFRIKLPKGVRFYEG